MECRNQQIHMTGGDHIKSRRTPMTSLIGTRPVWPVPHRKPSKYVTGGFHQITWDFHVYRANVNLDFLFAGDNKCSENFSTRFEMPCGLGVLSNSNSYACVMLLKTFFSCTVKIWYSKISCSHKRATECGKASV